MNLRKKLEEFDMNLRKLLVAVSASAYVILGATTAFATPVLINNPSFEAVTSGPPLPNTGGACNAGTGCSWSNGLIPGWTDYHVPGPLICFPACGGQLIPGTTGYFNAVPDGITVAYTTEGGYIWQQIGTVAANTIYTFTVDLGFRKDVLNPGSAWLQVNDLTNTVVLDKALALGSGVQFSGNFATYTAVYNSPLSLLGDPLFIVLYSPGLQGDFDNVSVDASVPEPASLTLLGSGLLAAGAALRRRKRRSKA